MNQCANSTICGSEGTCIPDQIGTAHCKCNAGFNGTYCRDQINCESFICQDGQYCLEENDSNIPQCAPLPTLTTTIPQISRQETTEEQITVSSIQSAEFDTLNDARVEDGTYVIDEILTTESESELPLYVIIILAVLGAIFITAIVLGGFFLRTRRRATGTYRYNIEHQ